MVTGEDVNHTHIYEKKYDDTNHWEECFICGSIQNINTHNKQVTGTAGCAEYLGYQREVCTDGCGYDKTLPKIQHTPSAVLGSFNEHYHRRICSVCGALVTDREPCVNSEGQILGCTTGIAGTCALCGTESLANHGAAASDGRSDNKSACLDLNCGKIMASYTIQTEVLSENSIKYTFITTFEDPNVTIDENIRAGSCAVNPGASFSNITGHWNSDGTYTSSAVVTYDENITAPGLYEVDITTAYAYNGEQVGDIHLGRVYVKSDNYVPTKVSVIAEGNGTIDNYSQKATVTAVYEDTWNPANNTIYMRLVDADGNVLSDWGAASQNGTIYTKTFDIVAEIREPRNVYVQVKDLCDNTTILEDGAVTVQYIDSKAPTLINTEDYTTPWSKNKTITFTAQDLGEGDVQIAFNEADDYKLAVENGDNYTRTYNFYGDVYDKVTAAIYLKDAIRK